jgi:pimeloyl-ACP methyl ester carboxylesterase
LNPPPQPIALKQFGQDGPLVVCESGIAGSHLNWMGLAPQLAEFTRVLVYDRAGYGESAPHPAPRTARQCAVELAELLEAGSLAQEKLILIGHSFGGLIVRLFAELRPQRVAGLILLDPILIGEWWPPTPASRRRWRRGVTAARLMAAVAATGLLRPLLGKGGGVESVRHPRLKQLLGEIAKMPAWTWPLVRRHWSQPGSFRTVGRYFASLEASCEDGARWAPIGDLPLTVISGAHLTPEMQAEHQRWASLSSHGRHLVATRGGHWVHLDAPELVVGVVRQHVAALPC